MAKQLPQDFVEQLYANATPLLAEAAKRVAGSLPVDMDPDVMMTTDREGRPLALVAMRTPDARASEAKHGHQISAAVGAGLDIRRYGGG